ncbi:MAG: cold shock and DUF1294 domain-containing protein [Collimonas sp.]|uniref:cold shock and DUF1294 domain-containing protein n=1 Tax=Collimonas sp. TaxID=1963772 RepID=UPI003264778A
MRYQGKITSWKDDKGFGFAATSGSGEKAFVHVKAFASRGRRPVEGDLISYELILEEKGRYRADKVRFAADRAIAPAPSESGSLAMIFTAVFCCFLVLASLLGRLPLALPALYVVTSVITFIVYAIDKSAAQSKQWRTKESTLHMLALIGGWPGAVVAQKILRHKSRKQAFQWIFWITVILNCCALGWLFTKDGSVFIHPLAGIL